VTIPLTPDTTPVAATPVTLQPGQQVATSGLRENVEDAAVMRIGRVTRYTSASITVAISGSDTLVNAAYLFGQYFPVLGDIVVVVKSGAMWVVLGTLSGNPADNVVENHSFEDSGPGTMPVKWQLFHDSASSAVADVATELTLVGREIDGSQWLGTFLTVPVGAGFFYSNDFIYSEPIPVEPGQTWSASAFVHALCQGPPDGVSMVAGLILAWFGNGVDLYPFNIVASDEVLAVNSCTSSLPWVRLRPKGDTGGTVVPTGAQYMRVVLQSLLAVDRDEAVGSNHIRLFFDYVVARRIT
jgi:hypothetical protein